jgi:hypothetical protein
LFVFIHIPALVDIFLFFCSHPPATHDFLTENAMIAPVGDWMICPAFWGSDWPFVRASGGDCGRRAPHRAYVFSLQYSLAICQVKYWQDATQRAWGLQLRFSSSLKAGML